jgi:signal transduction histidine kinase
MIANFFSKKNKPKSLEEQLKTDFVTLSSHQLRTPLSAIKWFTEILLQQKAGKLNKKQVDYLDEIHRSNERAIALVNDLLQVSRVEAGKLHLDLAKADLSSLLEEVIGANQLSLESNQLTYHFEIIRGPLPQVKIDKTKIKRVFQNLFSNAIKYSPRGGHIEIKLKRTENDVIFSVADLGLGIPIEQQERLFQKFFRGSNAAKIEPDGTGLGLFIAKSLIEAHKGKIWFESTEGKGTTFYFSIPIIRK